MGKNKSKKAKQIENEQEEEQNEDMYMQLTEIQKDEDEPSKKQSKKKKKSKSDKKKSSSSHDDEQGEDSDHEDEELMDIYDGREESISNLHDIKDINGFIVKQVFSPCETLTGCQTENAYEVFPGQSEDEEINEQSVPVLKSSEISNWCVRNLLSGRCRPFEMKLTTHIEQTKSQFHEQIVLVLKREFKCTLFCWQRPQIDVYQVKKGVHELVGRVLNPFNWCDLNLFVSDRFDKQLFTINASCCQCGFVCQAFGCRPCQEMLFNVTDSDGNEYTTIKKKQIGCCVGCVSDTSKYFINFPDGAENSEKLLLLAATILIDYLYFEGGSKICLNF